MQQPIPINLILIFLFLVLLLPGPAYSRSDDYKITHYTIDDGLPQSSVNSISFDRKGYCWLGTEAGLVRFDGSSFKVYGVDNLVGLQSERIRLITQDTNGTVHISTSAQEQIIIESGTPKEVSYPTLSSNSNIWMLSLAGFAMESPLMSRRAKTSGKSWSKSYTGAATQTGDFYLQEWDKKYYVHQNHFSLIDSGETSWDNFLLIGELFIVPQNAKRIAVWKKGILQRNISRINGVINENQAYKAGTFTCLSSKQYGFIYAGSTLYRIYSSKAGLQSEIAFDHVSIPTPTSVYYNEENRQYFIGSLTSGLYIVSPSFFHYPQMPQEAINDGFGAQAVTGNGDGVVSQRYLFRKDGTYSVFPIERLLGAATYLDSKHDLYYGYTQTLRTFNIKTGLQQSILNLDYRPSAIIPDKFDSSLLWVCTASGIYKIKGAKPEVSKKIFEPGAECAALLLVQTGKDSFLIGTTAGLKWYDHKRNLIYRSALNSVYIQSVYMEKPDRIWVSSFGKGLFLLEKGTLHSFSYQDYPALKTIHAIIDDGTGCFWLPTNNGIFKVSKNALLQSIAAKTKEVFYYRFSTKDNLRNNEFNGGCNPAYAWLSDSMLSVPSVAGPVWFYPNKVQLMYPGKNIYVDYIEVNHKKVNAPANGEINLEADFSMLKVSVSSPYFGNGDNKHLVYCIDGLDSNWRPLPDNGEITLNRIPHGVYKIIVRQMADLAGTGYHSLSLNLQIASPFYVRWWFYLLLVVLIVALCMLMLKFRTKLLRKRNRKLQAMLDLQTQDLSRTIIQLQQSEQKLQESNQVKDKVITMVLHDIRSPMRFLNAICKDVASKHKEMTQEMLSQKIAALDSCISALHNFTEQFFLWARSQHRHFKITKEHFALQEILDEAADLYGNIASVNNNELIVLPTGYFCNTDRQILSTVIRNLIDNANKNTRDGKITLAAESSADGLVISISDTGRGVTPEQLEAFLNRSPKAIPNGGYGSMLVQDLLYKIGSKLDVKTEPGVGTVFSIILIPHYRNPFD